MGDREAGWGQGAEKNVESSQKIQIIAIVRNTIGKALPSLHGSEMYGVGG